VISYAQQKTELDGYGRPTRSIAFALGAAPADSVTSYRYRLDGTLQDVALPDPSRNDASTLAYTYTFDSLGRPLTIRRPDAQQSGVDLSYSGLTTAAIALDRGSLMS
ncbi:MAG: hypothetical protein ABIV13_02190, partial [Fimbriimonadales bacterium]